MFQSSQPTSTFRVSRAAAALLAGVVMAASAQRSVAAPATIDPDATFGAPAFDERFQHLDVGDDQIRSLNPHRWRTVLGYGGPTSPSNRTIAQAYFDRSALAATPNGLVITATRTPSPFGRSWTSGLVTTKFSFSQPWGYFEATMDIPLCDRGVWPAFWLLPTTTLGAWPTGGEVDAPEAVGKGKLFWSLHSGAEGKKIAETTPWTPPGDPCSRGLHRYGALITPETIAYYYDRQLVTSKPTPSDFGQPLYMLIDLAIGGAWAGPPNADVNQANMVVRRVEAWSARARRQ